MSEYLRSARLRGALFSGGMVRAVTPGARLTACFQHPVHPCRLKTAGVVSSLSKERETMTTVISIGGTAAKSPTHSLDVIQLHAQAETALSMALHYMRQPTTNARGAARKAVQALAALNRLSACNPELLEG